MAASIGRFEVVRTLGKGGQGEVFLARDPHLDRAVAIKTLHGATADVQALLQEARIASKLQHQNIVTLFDAGEHQGLPYLVYAYVEGQTLGQLIRQEGTLSMARAAQIMCSVLDGITSAHQQEIVHLDLKPANIMMAASGQPLIMDFGIARTIADISASNEAISGSPQYIAPEIILGQSPSPSSDLFSLGMVLYEMVTGAPVAKGGSVNAILHKNAHEASESPGARNQQIDERLEAIILKALAKQPQERYADAASMKKALLAYLDPTSEEHETHSDGKHNSTISFLLRRMRSKSDFPALSSTISEINKVVDNDSASNNALTQSILQDFSLTNKLLRLVNTATYGQFGGNINTISKAVVILGFESVRNVAMALILFDFLQNKAQASQLKDDVLSSFLAGIVAAQFSVGRNIRDAEEAMICSMFRNLGKILASFYFFEESQEVIRLMEQGEKEDTAAMKVLGITYNELGIGIAKSWNFPPRLLAGMRKLSGEKIAKPHGELENMAVMVNLANELCSLASQGEAQDKAKALGVLSRRYENALPVTEAQLRKALDDGISELSSRAGILNVDVARSGLMKRINKWSGARTPVDSKKAADTLEGVTQLGMPVEGGNAELQDTIKQTPADADLVLSEGIQEVTNTLVDEYKLNDIMQMVLEVIHRGMGFQRTMIFVRDPKNKQMAARFGFGADIDSLLGKFRFALDASQDVFNLSMTKGVDLMIEDISADNIAAKIPKWYTGAVDCQSFLLLPIMVNQKAVGLFYADSQQAHSMQISPRQLSMLRTLRNQAVLAIKQKA